MHFIAPSQKSGAYVGHMQAPVIMFFTWLPTQPGVPPLEDPAAVPPVPPVAAPALVPPDDAPDIEALPAEGMMGSSGPDELLQAKSELPTNKPAAAANRTAALFTWIFTSNFLCLGVRPGVRPACINVRAEREVSGNLLSASGSP
jgi:hypothetical protein